MNSSTTSGSDFTKQAIDALFQGLDQGSKNAAHAIWNMLISFVLEHSFLVTGLLLLIFIVVLLKAMMGRWGSLGSFLYNFLYFGILFVIGLIWGPEVFVADLFSAACTVFLYPLCYFITGWVLDRTGLKRMR